MIEEICDRLGLADAALVDSVPREDLLGLGRLCRSLVLVLRHQVQLQLVAADERLVADEAVELSVALLQEILPELADAEADAANRRQAVAVFDRQ